MRLGGYACNPWEKRQRSDLLIYMRNCILKRKVAREASGLIPWQWVSAGGAAPGLRWRLTYETCKKNTHSPWNFRSCKKFDSFVDCSYTDIPSKQYGRKAESEAAWPGPEDRKHPSIHNSIVASPSRSIVAIVHCYRGAGQTLTSQVWGFLAASPRQTC